MCGTKRKLRRRISVHANWSDARSRSTILEDLRVGSCNPKGTPRSQMMSHGLRAHGYATGSDVDNDYDDGCGGGCIFEDNGPSCSTSYMPPGGQLQRSDHFQADLQQQRSHSHLQQYYPKHPPPHCGGPHGIQGGTTMGSGPVHDRPVQQQDIPHGRPAASVAGLDLFQSAVVSSSASTSLVVRSCAGSGKSTTLAVRAGELLARGLPPERLLVLTFSVRSKDDLHAKMLKLCPGARLPRVQTHHAHALLIARSAGCTARVVSASEQRKIVRELLGDKAHGGGGSGSGSGGRASVPKESVKAALHTIAKAKSSMTKPRAPKEVQLMNGYQSALRRLGCIDFEDMTSLACAALDDEPPGARYAHVMLDEAQDTSESQLALVTKLAPRGVTAITAVGDADQTIVS